jgi:hypothetical protein
MNINRNQPIKRIIFSWFLLFLVFAVPLLHGENIIIPGDVSRLCYYSNFFYNFPSEDFLYYLNDRLLFLEKPDDLIVPNGLRDQLLKIADWHKAIKKAVLAYSGPGKTSAAFNLLDPDEYKEASRLMLLLGYSLEKNEIGQYYLAEVSLGEDTGTQMGGYLDFSLINPQTLEQQLNKTHSFFFLLKESEVPLPKGLDLAFIRKVTGLKIDPSSFFESMLKNERLSLLMAVLFRLSDHEIRYIDSLNGWGKIYSDKKMLMGFFVLSNALRVKPDPQGQYRLVLPGGETTEAFWSQIVGANPSSFEFLQNLATRDEGKLDYLYVFSFFLPGDTRRDLFFAYDPGKVKNIYNLIALADKEKLKDSDFPGLDDWNFFTMMYALKTNEGRIYFPQGVDTWLQAVKGDNLAPSGSLSDLLAALLETKNNGKMSALRKFMAIYTKFSHRPGILGEGALLKLYNNYEKYNGLVDFIEKIPVKKPGTISKLFDWVRTLETLGSEDGVLFTMIYQSLFEILSFTAKYAPDRYDYDLLVSELLSLPLARAKFYRRLFQFFNKNLDIKSRGLTPVHVMLRGIPNPEVVIEGLTYRFTIRDAFQKTIDRILQAQEVCTFTDLLEINRLLEEGLKVKPPHTADIGARIEEIFQQLPLSGISSDAPKAVRDRVTPYSPAKLHRLVKSFVEKIHLGAGQPQLEDLAARIRGDYLIYQLRDHLLALTYAVNAKDEKLRAFINPNFLRLHDIGGCGGYTLWDNECQDIKQKKLDKLTGFHLSGGLSRLNLSFAARWQEHLFRENILYNPPHVQAVITNLLELYPIPMVDRSLTYQALVVELGLAIMREARENGSEALKQDVIDVLPNVTAGYHYRQAAAYIDGAIDYHNLYFNELYRVGEAFLEKFPGREYLVEIPAWKKLAAFLTPTQAEALKTEWDGFGAIYSQTFGNLRPRNLRLFPQEMSNLLASGWLSGSMIDEFKIKMAYHMHKKQMPPELLGQFLYMYLSNTGRRFLRQNHIHDYPITYFVFDILNTSHLNRLIEELKKEGYLKLK